MELLKQEKVEKVDHQKATRVSGLNLQIPKEGT